MEELLIKYQMGACNNQELEQVKKLLSEDESLGATLLTMQKMDDLGVKQMTALPLDISFEQKLVQQLQKEVANRAAIFQPAAQPKLITINEDNAFWITYGGPILLTIVSLISIFVMGIRQSDNNMNVILDQYSMPMILGCLCLVGWYALDQFLSHKQSHRNYMFSI